MITRNYYNKIGCDALSHKDNKKATVSLWLSHGGRGLMNVYCCDECAKIAKETDYIVGESIICNNN